MHTYRIVEHNWNQGNRWTVDIDGERRLGAVSLFAAQAFVAVRIFFEQSGYEPDELIDSYTSALKRPELQSLRPEYDRLNAEFNQNRDNLPSLPIGVDVTMQDIAFIAVKYAE